MSSPGAPPSGPRRAARVALWLLVAELGVLAVSGVLLFFWYRPSAAQAWDVDFAGGPDGVRSAEWLRVLHRTTSRCTVATALVAAVLLVVEAWQRGARRRRAGALVRGFVLFQLALLASITGYLLPWDQLALWAVTIGTELRGFTPLWNDDVRFVLLGGKEIGKPTLLRWVFVHTVVVSALLAGIVGWSLRRLRADAVPMLEAVEE